MPSKIKVFHEVARETADLVEVKQKAYGDSFGKSGKIMKILYPDGIKMEAMEDALTIVRIIDKLFRIATSKNAFNENPWNDILGYSLLAAARDRIRTEESDPINFVSPVQGWNLFVSRMMKENKVGSWSRLEDIYKSHSSADKSLLEARSPSKRTKPLSKKNRGLNGKRKTNAASSAK